MRALFLDRDGIINHDYGYVYSKQNFHFIDGIFSLCRLAIKQDMKIVIITNQSGIGRGYYSVADFLGLTNWMMEEFLTQDVVIDKVYYCPHEPDDKCHCRKPRIEMVKRAETELCVNLQKSIFIGDSLTDVQMGINAKIGLTIGLGTKFKEKIATEKVKYVENLEMAKQELLFFLKVNTSTVRTETPTKGT
jgi:D-glycero-D-manno-heptose 1,7-bisphosphate phosphatase